MSVFPVAFTGLSARINDSPTSRFDMQVDFCLLLVLVVLERISGGFRFSVNDAAFDSGPEAAFVSRLRSLHTSVVDLDMVQGRCRKLV